jgi:hypothetical protein
MFIRIDAQMGCHHLPIAIFWLENSRAYGNTYVSIKNSLDIQLSKCPIPNTQAPTTTWL